MRSRDSLSHKRPYQVRRCARTALAATTGDPSFASDLPDRLLTSGNDRAQARQRPPRRRRPLPPMRTSLRTYSLSHFCVVVNNCPDRGPPAGWLPVGEIKLNGAQRGSFHPISAGGSALCSRLPSRPKQPNGLFFLGGLRLCVCPGPLRSRRARAPTGAAINHGGPCLVNSPVDVGAVRL